MIPFKTEASAVADCRARIIDVHAHATLPSLRKATAAAQNVEASQATIAGVPLPKWSPEDHISFMDRQGIDVGILSWPEGTSVLRGPSARTLARSMNEELADVVARYPKRFGAFAVVPLDDMDAALEEMAYALDVLKLDGVGTPAQYDGAYLGEERYESWFAEMHRRKVVLFVHPSVPKGFEQVYVGPDVSTLEFMFDSTRMATKLLLSGFKKRFFDIRLISTHSGGTIPFLASRIAMSVAHFGSGAGKLRISEKEALEILSSFYFDLTASTSPAQLFATTQLVPTSQLLLGFDHPMMPEPSTVSTMAAFEAYPLFDGVELDDIRSGNALKLFPGLAERLGTF